MNPEALGKEELLELLDALSERLRRRRTSARIYVVGGACLALAYDRGRTTNDVDGRFDVGHGALVDAAREIARERGLPENWLNEQAVSAIPRAPDQRARTLYASDHLVVTGASAEYLLAMKLEAGRNKDMEDILFLTQHLNITRAEEALDIHARALPFSPRSGQARALLTAIAQAGLVSMERPRLSPEEDAWLKQLRGDSWPRYQREVHGEHFKLSVQRTSAGKEETLGEHLTLKGVALIEANDRGWPPEAVEFVRGFIAADMKAENGKERATPIDAAPNRDQRVSAPASPPPSTTSATATRQDDTNIEDNPSHNGHEKTRPDETSKVLSTQEQTKIHSAQITGTRLLETPARKLLGTVLRATEAIPSASRETPQRSSQPEKRTHGPTKPESNNIAPQGSAPDTGPELAAAVYENTAEGQAQIKGAIRAQQKKAERKRS